MNEDEIIARIQGLYPDASVEVAGENCSFEVYVVSPALAGQKTLERQRGILGLFSEEITSGKLPALTIKAKTPQEMQATPGLVQISL